MSPGRLGIAPLLTWWPDWDTVSGARKQGPDHCMGCGPSRTCPKRQGNAHALWPWKGAARSHWTAAVVAGLRTNQDPQVPHGCAASKGGSVTTTRPAGDHPMDRCHRNMVLSQRLNLKKKVLVMSPAIFMIAACLLWLKEASSSLPKLENLLFQSLNLYSYTKDLKVTRFM